MGRARVTDFTSVAGGRGPTTMSESTQKRPLTARGTVAIAPSNEASAMEVLVKTVTATYSTIVPAGNWTPGNQLPSVGDECLIVYDDLGDAFVPVYSGMSSGWTTGDLKLSAVAAAPAGWLVCDGTAYLQSAYPTLFAALGGTGSPWGHDSTHFNVPDLRGRTPIGSGTGTAPDATAHALGAEAGTENTTLTDSQMPVHSHGGATGTDSPDHSHFFSANTGYVSNDHSHTTNINDGAVSGVNTSSPTWNAPGTTLTGHVSEGISANHYHGVSGNTGGASARHTHGISSDGGGTAHTNMQPTTAVNYLIKT